jgi:glycosyltransferase involved in cell wall biosynthesis
MIQFENLSLKTFFNKKALTNYFEKRYLLKRYHINGGNRFIAVSNHTKQYFEKTVNEFPVILLHNAINLSKFFNKKNNSYHFKKLRLINVGSLVDNKNQSFLIDVAILLREKNVDFLLVLLGDGVNRAKLQKKITENNLDNFVKLMGNVDNVEDYLRNSDIYVHSSFSESLGLSIIEAMATGLPVVTIDGKGNRDLIENGKNGFILYEHNVELFADKIIELWSNKALYESMSHYAQEFAKKFDIKLYVHKLLQLYEDALNNKI